MGDALPWGDDEYNSHRGATDEAFEAWLVGIFESDICEGFLGDGKHVSSTVQETTDLPWTLRYRPEVNDGTVSTMPTL